MQTTLLRLGPGEEAEWAVLGSEPTSPVFVHRGRVEEASADANGRRLVVLVPTDALLLRQVVIAARNQRQLAKAVPYALEDDLAEGIDGLHFALGKRGDDGTPVAIVNESRLEAWLERLGAVDLKPYALTPDVLSLPWTRGEWSVLIEGEHALVRTGEYAGYACEAWDLRELLAASLADSTEEQSPSRLVVFALGEHLPDLGGLDIELAIEPVEESDSSALAVLARGQRPTASLNLLQGQFSYRDERSQALRPWYAAAALALAWITILFASRGYEYVSLKNQSTALTQQIEAVYRQTFPEAQRIVDARVQMEQQLRALRGGAGDDDSDFLALLAETAGLITAQQAVDVTAVSYRGGRLDLTVTAPNPQVLDSLRAQISERPGITAELQSVSASGDIASGQLRITPERT